MKLVRTTDTSWAGKTLVLPGVNSLGFAAELAVDALITHSNATRCAFLQSDIFLPVALPNCFGKGGITTGTEFYEAGDLLILQLRAPFATAHGRDQLAEFLIELKKEEGLKDLICLTTVSSHLRTDDDLRRQDQFLRVVNFTEIENEDHLPELTDPLTSLKYGGGVGVSLAERGEKVFAMFASEAVDITMVHAFTIAARRYLPAIDFEVKPVESWASFIPRAPVSIY